MRVDFLGVAMGVLISASPAAAVAQRTDIEQIREAIHDLRSDSEARIAELEQRLAIAEQGAASIANLSSARSDTAASSDASFNPSVGVVFSAGVWHFDQPTAAYRIPGFPLGGEAGPFEEGFALAETELIMNANVDDKFSAWLTLALAVQGGEAETEVEEAWIEATALPAGVGARFGRFFPV